VVEAGQTLVEVGDPRAMEIEVDVLSEDAVRIGPGIRVLLERWGGEEPLEARVRVIEPAGFTKVSALGVEEQRVLVISDFVSEPERWQRLGDGYRVEARFILWEAPQVLQVPASAVFPTPGGWAVFVVEGGRARQRPVRVGQRNGLSAQITEGLAEGEPVVVHPDRSLEEGERVAPRADRGTQRRVPSGGLP
jgi:HlyD family secretion protein